MSFREAIEWKYGKKRKKILIRVQLMIVISTWR